MANSPDVLAQFNYLEKTGALDALADLRKENRELERIITDAALIVANTDVDSMMEYVIAKLLDHFIPEFLAFLVHPPRGNTLRQFCYRNLKKTDEKIAPVYYEILTERFTRNPVHATFAELEGELGADVFAKDFRALKPEIIFPMFGIGGIYGTVIFGKKIIDTEYTELEQKYVDRMIRFLAVSMQNGLHYESSITDHKTGLYTHDYFIRRLDEAMARAGRHRALSGILMLDVDHFKRFNDTWGHVTGDLVLEAIAQVLKQSTRTEDCAARFGGEEFSVLVSDCNEKTLMHVAERIRMAIGAIHLTSGKDTLSVTVSIGARMIDARYRGRLGISPLILVGDADKALYRSKHEGRNRSSLFMQGLLERAKHLNEIT